MDAMSDLIKELDEKKAARERAKAEQAAAVARANQLRSAAEIADREAAAQKEKMKKLDKEIENKPKWYDKFIWMWKAAKDVATVDETPVPRQPEDAYQANHVSGTNVVYTIPNTMKKIKIRILEPNGRLKNQYTVTDYLDIQPGDKLHIRIEEK